MDDLSPEQVKAGRALLAWSQQELAAQARVSTSTIADFERGSRTPVANNAQAIRGALETQGLRFMAGGVVEEARMPAAPPARKPGTLMRWITATHLSQWGARRDAQGALPELISRLIYATAGAAASMRFPSDESVQFGGWDGVCSIGTEMKPVPEGISVWEIGAQRSGVKGKADDDYAKRAADPLGINAKNATFVFVTPQRFPNKEVWENEKRADGIWRDVRVIDADALVHWLELCPAVAQWLAEKMGRRPRGLRGLQEVWQEWSGATKTPLTADIILTDRDNESTAILKWLKESAQTFAIQAEAPNEAIAFLHATIGRLPARHRLAYESRCVVAGSVETARDLVGLGTPLIIVLVGGDAGVVQRLAGDGHHVFSVHGDQAIGLSPVTKLSRPWRFNLRMALKSAGVTEEDAHRLSRACGRSLAVLRRLMPATLGEFPEWARSGPELNAAMLAGAWDERSAADRRLVSALAGETYEHVESVLAPLAAMEGGPIRRVGSIWKLTSLHDAWSVLAQSVAKTQFDRFENAFHEVLSRANPRYEADAKEHWIEREGQFGDEHSGLLRRGICEAMIALGVYPEAARALPDGRQLVDRAIRKLLHTADGRLWWSLRGEFRELAEASPTAFLDAVDESLHSEGRPIMALFRSDEGFLHRQEYLADLLWALEMLARSPEHLPRAALLLAHLDDVDPGGKNGNRPAASLRQIFVTWTPQTYATPSQRLKVIDRIVRDLPNVGWRLLVALAPRSHDTSQPSPHPHWRDFTPDERENITWPAVARGASEIGRRLLDLVGSSLGRWESLLGHWSNFDRTWRADAVKRLNTYVQGMTDTAEMETLRDTLRDLLQKHRNFAKSDWAMREADLVPLDAVFARLKPTGPQERHRWLFRPGSNFFRPDVAWEDLQKEQAALQRVAAEELLAVMSPEAFLDYAQTVTLHHALGVAAATTVADEQMKDRLVRLALTDDRDAAGDVGIGMLIGLRDSRGLKWLDDAWERAVREGWGERAELRIVKLLPVSRATCDRILARSASLDRAYWETMQPHAIANDVDVAWAADKMIVAGRSREAMAWLGHNVARNPPAAVLIRVLRAAAASKDGGGNDTTMFSYYLGLILDHLEKDSSVAEQELVQLEWIFFQALRYSPRKPRTLHRALARHPDFFAQLINYIYLPDKNSGIEDVAQDRATAEKLAQQAFHVMHDWAHVPGADVSGHIDGPALESWVKTARKLCAESGRGEIGDQKIGEILAAAVREPDQPWPPEAVREVIESTRSKALEQGIQLGVVNRRGVTVRSPLDGGEQERVLAQQYLRDAEALRFDWVRTAAVLERIAESYAHDAKHEDVGAELRDMQ